MIISALTATAVLDVVGSAIATAVLDVVGSATEPRSEVDPEELHAVRAKRDAASKVFLRCMRAIVPNSLRDAYEFLHCDK
jgi:hypothetical protein